MNIKTFLFIITLLIINIIIISGNYDFYRNQYSIFFNRDYNLYKTEEALDDVSIKHLFYNSIFSLVKIGQDSLPIYLFLSFNHSDINIISKIYLNSISYNNESVKDGILKRSDSFKFPKAEELKDLSFNLNIKENIENENENISYLGLNINDNDLNRNSFINQLRDKKIIKNRRFSILYKENSISDDIQFDGQILFGLLPHELSIYYKEKDLTWTSIINDKNVNKWQIKFDSVNYYKEKDSMNVKEAEFDISLNLIIGPEEYREKILKNYFKKFIDEKICREDIFYNKIDKQFYIAYSCKNHYDIEDFPTLSFYSKELNETFLFKYEQLLCIFKNRVYLKIIFKKNEGSKKWILGRAFMQVFPLIFDVDNKKIGYYKINIRENNPIFISLFFVSIILIAGLAFYKGVKSEKNQKDELGKQKKDDDYKKKEIEKEKEKKSGKENENITQKK